MYKKNILVIGDSKKSNDSDRGFNLFKNYGVEIVFLSPSKDLGYDGKNYKLSLFNVNRLIAKIIRKHKIDLIYLRGDWFDKTIKIFAEKILSKTYEIPVVLGYHCHTAKPNRTEKYLVENSDALVLLNEWAQDYFEKNYNIEHKKISMKFNLYEIYIIFII